MLIAAVIGVICMFPLDRFVIGPDGIVSPDGGIGFGPLDELTRALDGPVRLGAVGLAIGSAVGA